jgi:hypothetical protein
MEYNDQAWVTAANNIVVELAQTNSLLEKNIQAVEGSRAALKQMCSGLELFLQQQREFQALLFKELQITPQLASEGVQMRRRRRWKRHPEVRRVDPERLRGL